MFQFGIAEKLIAGGVAILIIVAGISYFIHHQRSIGAEAERQKQVNENESFRKAVQGGSSSFDACDTAGGVFDFRKSTCQFK